ncbi:hypothetical protein BN946_scf185016.g100 [Trametes cinnabarina]|uniref:Uncharacterized protein n=1 Tax=Pycnoporus cinnabarinus TaxID=5643 RepID=A0A060SND9_PYCCI|nr:hypothetical protein BN946_scf185016.g100 [Trametes cinnabarina]
MLAPTDSASLPGSVFLPLIKISALLVTGYAVHRALSPPNPPPAPKACIDNRTLFERAIRHVTFCSKVSRPLLHVLLFALSPRLSVRTPNSVSSFPTLFTVSIALLLDMRARERSRSRGLLLVPHSVRLV